MAIVDILKLIKFEDLTDAERAKWKQKLQVRKRELEVAMRAVDSGLKTLAKKRKLKKAKKAKKAKKGT